MGLTWGAGYAPVFLVGDENNFNKDSTP